MSMLESFASKIVSAVRSDSMLIRTLILLIAILLFTLGGMEYIRRVWRDNFELRTPGANGAVIFHSSYDDGFRKVVFLVPASQCWINTQLLFKPGETIKFTTSGKVHLALNQIRQEELPVIKWSKPDGSPFITPLTGGDRSQFLICQHADDNSRYPLVGNLVGFLQAENIDAEPGPDNPRPVGAGKNKVFHIGHEYTITNETGHKAYLWLTVNDIVLDSSQTSRQAYLGEKETFMGSALKNRPSTMPLQLFIKQAESDWSKHVSTWDTLRKARQWDLYFNDNIGTYLVFIEKTEATSF